MTVAGVRPRPAPARRVAAAAPSPSWEAAACGAPQCGAAVRGQVPSQPLSPLFSPHGRLSLLVQAPFFSHSPPSFFLLNLACPHQRNKYRCQPPSRPSLCFSPSTRPPVTLPVTLRPPSHHSPCHPPPTLLSLSQPLPTTPPCALTHGRLAGAARSTLRLCASAPSLMVPWIPPPVLTLTLHSNPSRGPRPPSERRCTHPPPPPHCLFLSLHLVQLSSPEQRPPTLHSRAGSCAPVLRACTVLYPAETLAARRVVNQPSLKLGSVGRRERLARPMHAALAGSAAVAQHPESLLQRPHAARLTFFMVV